MAPEDQLDEILRTDSVRTVYQPIVELVSGDVVAFEALSRGPEGTELERPDLLFATARACGRVAELDWLCRATALRGALDAGLKRPLQLFVNVAAEAVDALPPERFRGVVREANDRLGVVRSSPSRRSPHGPRRCWRPSTACGRSGPRSRSTTSARCRARSR
jgi:EAL domain-containing protein (putative c-di-GMP-specific phosphodiesterase class I)